MARRLCLPLCTGLCMGFGLLSAPALGGPVALLNISANIAATCDIGGSPSGALASGLIDFGSHTREDAPQIAVTGDLPIRCNSAGTALTISFDDGENATGSQRYMRGPGGVRVPYELRQGSASAPLWDDQPHSIATITDETQQISIYGRIVSMPAETPDGSYSDLVRIRIDY